MSVDSPVSVRLNQEVSGVVWAEVVGPKAAGELVMYSDCRKIVDFELPEEEANSAYITAILHSDRWFLKFDFSYNSARIEQTLAAAREFLDIATQASISGKLRPAVDCLFSATELMGRAFLLALPDEEVVRSKSHSFVSSRLNLGARDGVHYGRYAKLINTLSDLRPGARYLRSPFSLGLESLQEMIVTAEAMYAEIGCRLGTRFSK
jgi:hypothetical protein